MIMHPGVKLRHIRAFLAIAAAGNLSAVARAQGITQPALSRTLSELEDLLAQPLFLRQGRRLLLTEAGALFRRHASIGLQALDAGAAALAPGAGGGTLTVGVLPTVATRLFPKVALRFHDLAPETLLSVITGPHHYLMGLLRSGAVDLMLGRMPAPVEMADLGFDHLYEEEVVLVARAGHPAATLPPGPEALAAALVRWPVIVPPPGAIIRRTVDDYLATLGLTGFRAAYETVAQPVGRGIVTGSETLWFISRGVVLEELERGELIVLPTAARFLSGAVGLTRRQSASNQSGVDLLVQVTREIARSEALGQAE
ncbi:LysR substrate-binding domain-containing protein [Phaeovulum sp. W22_SRMD_FR3]|uniref:LysR substrate-binding domain-containing protein n=1 Tax=Phaeovulum sp. W22_SRMD_FR3 TaxID=3240274 RepID=UPI003F9693F9